MTTTSSTLTKFNPRFEHVIGGTKYWVAQLTREPQFALVKNQASGKYMAAEYANASWTETKGHSNAWDIVASPSVDLIGVDHETGVDALVWLEACLAKRRK